MTCSLRKIRPVKQNSKAEVPQGAIATVQHAHRHSISEYTYYTKLWNELLKSLPRTATATTNYYLGWST